jgi:hypothetical protein
MKVYKNPSTTLQDCVNLDKGVAFQPNRATTCGLVWPNMLAHDQARRMETCFVDPYNPKYVIM